MGFLDILRNKVFAKPATIPAEVVKDKEHLSKEELVQLRKLGMTLNLTDAISESTQINFDRYRLYKDLDRAQCHWLMSAAIELYADFACTLNPIHGKTVWITSENGKYETTLTDLLERIGVEEKIFDWAWTLGNYGDHFVKCNGIPGAGVVSIEDNDHPINISRVDHQGVLVGFFETPVGGIAGNISLMPPWQFSHFRVLGVKRRRPIYGDPMFAEYRTISILAPDKRRLTTKYGTSLLINGLPVYKRLRLAEDSLLLARLTRGMVKYIYKIGVEGMANIEAVDAILDEYATTIKRARALQTDPNDPNYDSKFNPMAAIEDIFIPVWGDVNNLQIDKVGGETDIKWIVDVEELRNQLACALRTPLSLLGGFVEEATGSLGSQAIEKLDIRFARNARRLQRALREGIKRVCQIHLAYMGMDPDPRLFDVNMSETSTAEEESLRESLETAVDVVDKMLVMFDTAGIKLDKVRLINYLNQKMLKLSDLDLDDYVLAEEEATPVGQEEIPAEGEIPLESLIGRVGRKVKHEVNPSKILESVRAWSEGKEVINGKLIRDKKIQVTNGDMFANLPVMSDVSDSRNKGNDPKEASQKIVENKDWQSKYGKCKIEIAGKAFERE